MEEFDRDDYEVQPGLVLHKGDILYDHLEPGEAHRYFEAICRAKSHLFDDIEPYLTITTITEASDDGATKS